MECVTGCLTETAVAHYTNKCSTDWPTNKQKVTEWPKYNFLFPPFLLFPKKAPQCGAFFSLRQLLVKSYYESRNHPHCR